MTDFSPNLGMPFLEEGQGNADITHNEALLILDTMVQTRVIDKDLTAPPGSPSEGDRYIVAAVATGDWTGNEDKIAFFFGGIWKFITPLEGWRAFVEDEAIEYNFNGTAWVTGGAGSGLTLLTAIITAAGGITLQTSAVGATVSVGHPGNGIYDLTFTGLTGFTNLGVYPVLHNHTDLRAANLKGVTDKTADTGRGTTAGCRIRTMQLTDQSGGTLIGEPGARDTPVDFDFSFKVEEIN